MTVDVTVKEQKLIEKARKLSDEQLDKLMNFLDTIVTPSASTSNSFWGLSNRAGKEAQENGLTYEMLQEILKEIDESRR